MTKEISGHARGEAKAEVHVVVVAGWDERAQLVLAILFTGCVPLAVALGVEAGLVLAGSVVWRCLFGLVVAVVTLAAPFGLLYLFGTSYWFRQRFIPFARKMFPPSDQMRR